MADDDLKSYRIPQRTPITLLSRGYLYKGKLSGGTTTVTPMTTKTEKFLMGAKAQDRAILIDYLLSNHLDDQGVGVDNLLVGDRLYALFMIRNITYGPEYRFNVRCDSCGEQFPLTINIPDDLQLRMLDESDAVEPFEVLLPISGSKVGLRHTRGYDEKRVRDYVRDIRLNTRGNVEGDPGYTFRMALSIASIDGAEVKKPTEILDWIDSLHSADSHTINQTLTDHSCGVDIRRSISCVECSSIIDFLMPITMDFFRPKFISLPTSGPSQTTGELSKVRKHNVQG